jgi:hypothetical protein
MYYTSESGLRAGHNLVTELPCAILVRPGPLLRSLSLGRRTCEPVQPLRQPALKNG